MKLADIFTVAVIMGAIATVLGWWLKSRLDSSIQHEYNRLFELFKAEQKRTEILHSERLEALKVLSTKLLAMRRYCHAMSADIRNQSEFEPRPDSLEPNENMSLLQHREIIGRAMEEKELFLSPEARRSFDELFAQMAMGFNLELWLSSGNDAVELNADSLYDLVSSRVNDVMSALYNDLGFPTGTAPNKSQELTE